MFLSFHKNIRNVLYIYALTYAVVPGSLDVCESKLVIGRRPFTQTAQNHVGFHCRAGCEKLPTFRRAYGI